MIRAFTIPYVTLSILIATQPAHALSRITTTQAINSGVPAPLARAVESAGVPVYDGSFGTEYCETPGHYALYNFKYNVILICRNNSDTPEKFVSSYTHEAVHLVQDCRTGIDTATLNPGPTYYLRDLINRLHPHRLENIIDSYQPQDYAVEVEAFYFQDYPLTVAETIKAVCPVTALAN